MILCIVTRQGRVSVVWTMPQSGKIVAILMVVVQLSGPLSGVISMAQI